MYAYYIYIYICILYIYVCVCVYTGLEISAGHQTMSNIKTETSTDVKFSYY